MNSITGSCSKHAKQHARLSLRLSQWNTCNTHGCLMQRSLSRRGRTRLHTHACAPHALNLNHRLPAPTWFTSACNLSVLASCTGAAACLGAGAAAAAGAGAGVEVVALLCLKLGPSLSIKWRSRSPVACRGSW
jgi:hypothetical protein